MMKHLIVSLCGACLLASCATNTPATYNWNDDLHHRILHDFRTSRSEVKEYIQQYIPNVTDQQMDAWESSKALEYMQADGKKVYFNQAGPNLFRIDSLCASIKEAKDGIVYRNWETDDVVNIPEILQATRNIPPGTYPYAVPKRMRITYTLTVNADAVPAGRTIRCWLPFPRTDEARQQDVRLLSTFPAKYRRAPQHAVHSTVFMTQKAVAGQPTVFKEVFEYTACGAKFWLTPQNVGAYDKKSKLYRQYTAEREKHVVFTPTMRQLAARLTQGESNPYLQAKRIFLWINDHFPWASAREYSTIDNIPEYVYKNKHGDCGQVSLLFITLCRICGIPARFESGFMVHPHDKSLHDWAEVYFQNFGWVPVDQSFGIPAKARTDEEKMFFLGGIDSWRMIVNRDFGFPLYPKKIFPRSETVDFQRGEVEWDGGNLYFDQWKYNYDIQHL